MEKGRVAALWRSLAKPARRGPVSAPGFCSFRINKRQDAPEGAPFPFESDKFRNQTVSVYFTVFTSESGADFSRRTSRRFSALT